MIFSNFISPPPNLPPSRGRSSNFPPLVGGIEGGDQRIIFYKLVLKDWVTTDEYYS
jgi:hypothetical protein